MIHSDPDQIIADIHFLLVKPRGKSAPQLSLV